ncbi:helix-hairpin-helix domain-containing protein [Candidatus Microgenomates bacterium]|nr:helix-hairpin-helix domain-containing protein [Candidatus Microgenomates bacterium]
MEFIQNRLSSLVARLNGHRLEAALTLIGVGTAFTSALLLIFSVSHAQHSLAKDYQEAPKVNYTSLGKSGADKLEGAGDLVVDIAGAVTTPGIYHLPAGSRINDALQKADGLSGEANREYISHIINLAELLQDQEKIYIPKLGEDISALSSQHPLSAIVQNTANGLSVSPFLSINSASKSELENLPGIGEITAEKIIAGRPYSSVEELSNKGILKKTLFEGLKEKISL